MNKVENIDCDGCEKFETTKTSIKNADLFRKIINGVPVGKIDVKCNIVGMCYYFEYCDLSKIDCIKCKEWKKANLYKK